MTTCSNDFIGTMYPGAALLDEHQVVPVIYDHYKVNSSMCMHCYVRFDLCWNIHVNPCNLKYCQARIFLGNITMILFSFGQYSKYL